MSTRISVVWNGSPAESADLAGAVSRNCACPADVDGLPTPICVAHRMLLSDQRALDGLVFVRRIADRLRTEEWGPPDQPGPTD